MPLVAEAECELDAARGIELRALFELGARFVEFPELEELPAFPNKLSAMAELDCAPADALARMSVIQIQEPLATRLVRMARELLHALSANRAAN